MEARRVALFGGLAYSLVNFRGPLIKEMVRRGHEVYAMAGAMDEAVAAKLRDHGATPIPIQFGPTSLNPANALKERRRVTALLREIKPDLLLPYTIKPIVLGVPAARKAGVERVVPLVTGLGYAFTGGREPKRLIVAQSRLCFTAGHSRSPIWSSFRPDDRADFARKGILPRKTRTGLITVREWIVQHLRPYAPAGERRRSDDCATPRDKACANMDQPHGA
jgi:hypothetical protein